MLYEKGDFRIKKLKTFNSNGPNPKLNYPDL